MNLSGTAIPPHSTHRAVQALTRRRCLKALPRGWEYCTPDVYKQQHQHEKQEQQRDGAGQKYRNQ